MCQAGIQVWLARVSAFMLLERGPGRFSFQAAARLRSEIRAGGAVFLSGFGALQEIVIGRSLNRELAGATAERRTQPKFPEPVPFLLFFGYLA